MSLDPAKMDTNHIKNVQKVLNDKLGSNLEITGKFDILTRVALARFQRKMQIPETCNYDEATQLLIEPSIKGVSMSDNGLVITQDQFRQMVGTDAATAAAWYEPMTAAMVECGIVTKLDACAFLAQIGHETNGLKVLSENLNYSADGLANTWPNRYAEVVNGQYVKVPAPTPAGRPTVGTPVMRYKPNALALKLNRNPQAIANNVYANRLGNGDEASGDGWNHRGMGPIQLTGKDNQATMGKKLGVDLVANPELLMQPVIGSRASAHFWLDNGVSAFANKGDFDGVSDKVNLGRKTEKIGDAIGYADRLSRFNANRKLLNV
jgi:putative chitinase